MRSLDDEAIKTELTRFKGVGAKTVACVLMFCLDRAEFPVDTHVHRIATKILKWAPAAASRDETYAHLNRRVPDPIKYDLHVLLVEHGKRCRRCATNGQNRKEEHGPCPLTPEGLASALAQLTEHERAGRFDRGAGRSIPLGPLSPGRHLQDEIAAAAAAAAATMGSGEAGPGPSSARKRPRAAAKCKEDEAPEDPWGGDEDAAEKPKIEAGRGERKGRSTVTPRKEATVTAMVTCKEEDADEQKPFAKFSFEGAPLPGSATSPAGNGPAMATATGRTRRGQRTPRA